MLIFSNRERQTSNNLLPTAEGGYQTRDIRVNTGKYTDIPIGQEKDMSGDPAVKGGPPYGGGVGSEMHNVSYENALCELRPNYHS